MRDLFKFQRLMLGLLVLLVAVFDPFGLNSSTETASAHWLNRVFATWYDQRGQQNVVVVLIDDAYLKRNNSYWPMPYAEQSKLFKRLLAYKPSAVFVDLLYSHDHSRGDPRQSSQLLANIFERYRRQGIPISLANTGLERGAQGGINVLSNFAGLTSPALVTWSGYNNRYPLAVATPIGTLATPAFELYRHYCQQHACENTPLSAETASREPALAVQWGLKLAPQQAQVANTKHCEMPGFFTQLLQAVFWKITGFADANCPYTLTISASDLEATSVEDRALLSELLNNKLVLVGANITSTGDVVQSPLHGKIPGVYLHAMALDNLITWGMGYQRDPAVIGFGMTLLDWGQLALLLFIAVITAEHARCQSSTSSGSKPECICANRFCLVLIVILPIALLSLALYITHFTPANVLGVLLLSLALIKDTLKSYFEDVWQICEPFYRRVEAWVKGYCSSIFSRL